MTSLRSADESLPTECRYPTSFFLRDKTIYTGNLRKGTTVHNPDGSVAFQTRDAVLSLRNKEVVYDALGTPIASLHKKSISMVSRYFMLSRAQVHTLWITMLLMQRSLQTLRSLQTCHSCLTGIG